MPESDENQSKLYQHHQSEQKYGPAGSLPVRKTKASAAEKQKNRGKNKRGGDQDIADMSGGTGQVTEIHICCGTVENITDHQERQSCGQLSEYIFAELHVFDTSI